MVPLAYGHFSDTRFFGEMASIEISRGFLKTALIVTSRAKKMSVMLMTLFNLIILIFHNFPLSVTFPLWFRTYSIPYYFPYFPYISIKYSVSIMNSEIQSPILMKHVHISQFNIPPKNIG